ncbi:MAG: hypothetical protein K940chlam7_01149 [Chlamydiae bacterium]|nr:hypothetical protein [Chlamydiota bacterium]
MNFTGIVSIFNRLYSGSFLEEEDLEAKDLRRYIIITGIAVFTFSTFTFLALADKNKRLQNACDSKSHYLIKFWSNLGADVDHVVREAYKSNKIGTMQILFNRGADLNMVGDDGKSLLHLACESGNLDVARLLLGYDETVLAISDKETVSTPLRVASKHGCEDLVEYLLTSGAEVDALSGGVWLRGRCCIYDKYDKRRKGRTPLYVACSNGHTNVAKLLLDKRANIEATSPEIIRTFPYNHAMTALHAACRNGHYETAELLLDRGAKIEAVDRREDTALHIACRNGKKNIVELLLDRGANVEAKNCRGISSGGEDTPLHIACEKDEGEIVELLIKRKADPNAKNGDGRTPLFVYCEQKGKWSPDLATILLEAGADINVREEILSKDTILDACLSRRHWNRIRFLVSKGADLENCSSFNFSNALKDVCAAGHEDLVELLVNGLSKSPHLQTMINALVYPPTGFLNSYVRVTVLEVASKFGHEGIVKILLAHGATTIRNAIDVAKQEGHMNIVVLLRAHEK